MGRGAQLRPHLLTGCKVETSLAWTALRSRPEPNSLVAGWLAGCFRGVVLLNAAGRFESPEEIAAAAAGGGEAAEAAALEGSGGLWRSFVEGITTAVKRGVVLASFVYTKNPLRIKQVLRQVRDRCLCLAGKARG